MNVASFGFLTSILLLPTMSLANEQLAKQADSFTAKAQIDFLSCGTKAQNELSISQLMQLPVNATPIQECVRKSKEERGKEFSDLKSKLAKNRDGSVALKDYYAFWLASMESISAATRTGEMHARSNKLNEMGNRLTVEVR